MSDDATLLTRLRAGDAAAIELLMATYADRVFRLAYGVTRNDADAQEVVQDVFLTVFRKHASFQGRAALASWIYRIAMNAALNKRRGKRRDVETSLDADLPRFHADGHRDGDRAYLVADWSQTPEAEALSGEWRAVLTRAIESLPDRYRVVLILRDVEGLSNEEVAAAIDDTVGSVKSRLHRARMAVREQLTRHFHGTP
ncbi:MAG TPA: sigma-70 family RNA polymerase sigma factor [Terriglobales bacterium]|nr:sigma-70 family RNA polymerase sigma factor [Terriglobales bacterium]